MSRLAILGASGHGKVAADIAKQVGWQAIHFYDDAHLTKKRLEIWPVVGCTQDLLDDLTEYAGVFVAIGNGLVRHKKLALLRQNGFPLISLIHPRAIVSDYAVLDEAVMVVGGAVINAFARIGAGVVVNTGATVGHDCHVGEAVHIAPGANVAGDVRIGSFSWIGVGAAVRQGVRIGSHAVVGAGAAVVADVADGQTVVGVPAKPLKPK